jgi:hypothetical protein
MKILNIIESAYRGTLEEQDDTVVWITHAMKGAGGDFTVLLRGNAVNYGLTEQDASGLSFGAWQQTQPPRVADQVSGLVGKGVEVYYVAEDASERGLAGQRMTSGLKPIARDRVVELFTSHDQVWNW